MLIHNFFRQHNTCIVILLNKYGNMNVIFYAISYQIYCKLSYIIYTFNSLGMPQTRMSRRHWMNRSRDWLINFFTRRASKFKWQQDGHNVN